MQLRYEQIQFKIEPEFARIRLDRALSQHPLIRTRSRAARLLEQGLITREGQPAKPSYITQAGDVIEISLPVESEPSDLIPLKFELDVLHEDNDLLVINKPAGLVVHPAAGHAQDTLVNALLHHTQNLSTGFAEQRPGIVHRLDKDTSGLIVIAKNDRAQEHLAHQFRTRQVQRLYWAIVFGRPKQAEAKLSSNLIRHPQDRKRFASARVPATHGKLAITNYKILQISAIGLSLLQLKLETGRTHQIRVHLTEMGYPIVGDSLYGADNRVSSLKSIPLRKLISGLSRFALHAAELGFVHPASGEWMSFHADWPADLESLVEACAFQ